MSTNRPVDILKVLASNGGWMTRQEIGEAIGMHRYGVAHPVKHLESRGLVETRSANRPGPGRAAKMHRVIKRAAAPIDYIPLTPLDKKIVKTMREVGAWRTQSQLSRLMGERQVSVCRAMRRLLGYGLVERVDGNGPWHAPLYRLMGTKKKDFDDPNSPWKGWALGRALGGLGYNTREAQQWRA